MNPDYLFVYHEFHLWPGCLASTYRPDAWGWILYRPVFRWVNYAHPPSSGFDIYRHGLVFRSQVEGLLDE